MAKFHFTRAAVEDLGNIWEYTVKTWSENQADSYYSDIIEACQHIAQNPALGKNYDGVSEELLGFRTGQHIVFYRVVSQNEITIIRILHGRMDLKNRIQEQAD